MLEENSLPNFNSLYELKNKGSFKEEYSDYKRIKITKLNGQKVRVDDFKIINSKINKIDKSAYIFVTTNNDEKYLIITSSGIIIEELQTIENKGIKSFIGIICTDNKYYTFK